MAAASGYADSIDDPSNPASDNTPIFQRHWIGVTPMEAILNRGGQTASPLASTAHANTALDQRETACYTGEFGLFHTGTGATSDPAGNPGAMPEIAPSPDSAANIGRPFYDRSMALQAWGAYGILWPVIHQQLGVDPDLGHGRIAVVPQIPAGQQKVAGSNIRVGRGSLDVSARLINKALSTEVTVKGAGAAVTVGAVLPSGAKVRSVSVNGHAAQYRLVTTTRGTEVQVPAKGSHTELRIALG
jgi:hypothetical protein